MNSPAEVFTIFPRAELADEQVAQLSFDVDIARPLFTDAAGVGEGIEHRRISARGVGELDAEVVRLVGDLLDVN